MPTHDFENVGDVLDFEILKGTITAVDSATDTCTVTVAGSSRTALLFYHCKPDSVARSNGAIEGAAAGFKEGDEVVVMVKGDDSIAKVIGHTDGVRKCGGLVIFTITVYATSNLGEVGGPKYYKPVVVVWDVSKNAAKQFNSGTIPLDSDEDYDAWHHSTPHISRQLLSSTYNYNTDYLKVRPDLVNEGNIDYHANTGNSLPYPKSTGQIVTLPKINPSDPFVYNGFRTKQVRTYNRPSGYRTFSIVETRWSLWDTPIKNQYNKVEFKYYYPTAPFPASWDDWGDKGYPDDIVMEPMWPAQQGSPPSDILQYSIPNYYYDNWETQGEGGDSSVCTFYGLLDKPMAEFHRIETNVGEGYLGTWIAKQITHLVDIPQIQYPKKRFYFETNGCFTDKILASVTVLQYQARTSTIDYSAFRPDGQKTITTIDSEGAIERYVQAEAITLPDGPTGFQWPTGNAGNAALEAKLLEAIEKAYTVSETTEIRPVGISIEIVE